MSAALAAEVIMSKPPRDLALSGSNSHFVTTGSWGHRPLFQTQRVADLLIDTLLDYRRQHKFLLHEFVVMPNHIHLILTPQGITLERSIQFIKGGFSYRVKKELAIGTEIWERGYVDHRLRDAGDYWRHAAYIRQNPVEARLASRSEDYPYSSANTRFELDPCPQGLKPQLVRTA
jgi:REP-associated tyrosine transposase